jgi:hypothetical protein
MTIQVPENLNEITLAQYMKFDSANKEDSENEFLIHRIINIFCGVRMKDCLKMPLQDAEEIAEEIAGVLSQTSKLQTTFEHNGVRYGMIPDLTKISLGEYVDLEEYLKDTQTLHKAMAVLYRPIVKEHKNIYDIGAYTSTRETAEEMKSIPCNIATAATLFFWNLSNELVRDSQAYLKRSLQENKENKTSQERDSSPKSTDGLRPYTHWLAETLPNLIK